MKTAHCIQRKQCAAGFTLIELLASAAILSVSIAAIVHIVAEGRKAEFASVRRFEALALSESILEEGEYQPGGLRNQGSRDNGEVGAQTPCTTDIVVVNRTEDFAGQNIAFSQINITSRWPENGGMEAVTIVKWITD
jgi:prepilin-type N-terminal cleavage/methylation domain-containing protein